MTTVRMSPPISGGTPSSEGTSFSPGTLCQRDSARWPSITMAADSGCAARTVEKVRARRAARGIFIQLRQVQFERVPPEQAYTLSQEIAAHGMPAGMFRQNNQPPWGAGASWRLRRLTSADHRISAEPASF